MKRVWLVSSSLVGLSLVLAFLASSSINQRAETVVPARTVLYYRDPMHPSYTSDKPGKAPDCGMDLVPVYAGADTASQGGTIVISRERQQLIGVRLGRVERSRTTQMLRTFGRVALDENRIFSLAAGAEGWVTQIAPNTTTGDTVETRQPLVSVTGRDFTAAQRQFLYALRTVEESVAPVDPINQPTVALEEARRVLEYLGFADDQIKQLARSREPVVDITLASRASGVIVARNVFLQQRFDKGTELFRIADLSHVWIVADLFGDDTTYVRNGAEAMVSITDRPTTVLHGTVDKALAPFDSDSRTLKLRIKVDNPHLMLRPNMLVDVQFPIELPEATTVPAEAIVETGLQKTVFVNRGEGIFEPRAVTTGWRFGDRVQIVHGLDPGETVVVSGNFLLDSESRMQHGDPGGHD
jgi:membrane fusion protein, copper/silver efflux system